MTAAKSLLLAAICLMSAVAPPTPAKAAPAPSPPPYTGGYQPSGVDETGIWREDDESERVLANSPLVIRDEALTSYVTSVLCSAVGTDRCSSARVYILRIPLVNASMSSNGTMRVNSGLLLRMRSEAELAAVLGHEFGHFEQRHSLKRFKAARSGTDLLSWAALASSMSPSYAARQNFDALTLSVYGSLYRYSRDNEREADLLGLGYLNRSALRPQSAADVWQGMMEEEVASAKVKGLKKPRFDRVAFFASHPPEGERAGYLTLLADPAGLGREDGQDRYRAVMAKWAPTFLDDQIKLNDFGASEYLITRLAKGGWTTDLWFARGELFRLRGSQRDHVNAVEFYTQALQIEPDRADATRGLGISLMKTGRRVAGLDALRRFLTLAPDDKDAKMIAAMLPLEDTTP